jgi:hypothetical protein
MRLSKETIDKCKNTCYEKEGGKLLTFIIEPTEGLNKERLLNALSLILSEKDVIGYLKLREHSLHHAGQGFGIKKKEIL